MELASHCVCVGEGGAGRKTWGTTLKQLACEIPYLQLSAVKKGALNSFVPEDQLQS